MENFGKLWKTLENFGKLWKTLENFGKFWKTLENFGKLWKTLENFGKLWKTLENFGKLWKTLENFGKFWKTLKIKNHRSLVCPNEFGRMLVVKEELDNVEHGILIDWQNKNLKTSMWFYNDDLSQDNYECWRVQNRDKDWFLLSNHKVLW